MHKYELEYTQKRGWTYDKLNTNVEPNLCFFKKSYTVCINLILKILKKLQIKYQLLGRFFFNKSYTVCINVSLKMPKKGLWLWLIKHQLGGKRPSIGIVLSDAKKVKIFWDWVMRWLSISKIAQISRKRLLSKLQVTFNQIHSLFLQLPKVPT